MNFPVGRWAALIPAHNEERFIADVVRQVRARGLDVWVIDDGSADRTAERAREAGAEVIRLEPNRGKGAALREGVTRIREQGYEWVVMLDGDGQHDPADLLRFFEAAAGGAADVVCGNRLENPQGMPWIRLLTNRLMSRWISRAAGQRIPDSQCGYRAVSAAFLPVFGECAAERFEWESEFLVRASRRGARIASVPVRTIYGEERSKIRPIRDTLRFWRMWRRLNAKGARR